MKKPNYKKTKPTKSWWFLIIILIVFLFAAIIILLDLYYSKALLNDRIDEDFSFVEKEFNSLEQRDSLAMQTVIQTLAKDAELKKIFLDKNRTDLYNYSKELFEENKDTYGITHWYFIDLDGRVFLRVHKPELYNDLVERITYKQASSSKNVSSGIEFGKTAFALRVVVPYFDNDKLIGYLELGREIDSFFDTLKKETGNDFAITVNKNIITESDWNDFALENGLVNTWNEDKDYLIIDRTFINESSEKNSAVYNNLLKNNAYKNQEYDYYLNQYEGEINNYAVGYFHIKNVEGEDAGVVYILKKINDLLKINQLKFFTEFSILLFFALFLIFFLYLVFISVLKSEKKYSRLVNNTSGAVCRFGVDDKRSIYYISDQISEINGFTKEDLLNSEEGFIPFVYYKDRKSFKKDLSKVVYKKEKYSLEYRLKNKSKGFSWVKEIGKPVLNSKGVIIHLDSIIFDVSRDKEIIRKTEARERELQKINKFMIGRELKMIELKKEINRLKKSTNKKS